MVAPEADFCSTKFPLAQGEPGASPEGDSTSRMERDLEELQDSATGWTILGDDEISRYGLSNITLLGKLGSGRTLSSIQRDIPTGEEELDHSCGRAVLTIFWSSWAPSSGSQNLTELKMRFGDQGWIK